MTQTLRRFLLLLTLFAHFPAAPAAGCDDPQPLRFALVPMRNVETQLAQYRPLLHQLERKLGRRVEIVPSPSYGTVIEGLLAGQIDLAELGPASYAIAKRRGAAKITAFASFALRPGTHTKSSKHYHSLLIARQDKGFDNFSQLRGATLSLTDPASTSGGLFPRHAFSRLAGMPLDQFFQRITFSGSHDRAVHAVQKGLVEAAFVSSTAVDEAIRRGTLATGEVNVLWQSSPIPYDPFVYREQLCPSLVARIKQVFLSDTSSLRSMFEDLHMTGIIPVTDENYREIREIYASTAP